MYQCIILIVFYYVYHDMYGNSILSFLKCMFYLWVWFLACPLFGGNFILTSHVGSSSFVRCPESRSVRFSEVALVLQLC